ncbi:MAG: hypothetical protein ACFFDN_05040 [Candidatus Hodarchaeota archaeon]
MTELGVYAYNSLKDNIDTIKTPSRRFKSPILRKLMLITSKRFILFEKEDKLYAILISISIIILGIVFCGLNGFYSFLLFFLEANYINSDVFLRILISFSFLFNFLIFFIIMEGICRLFYNKKENTWSFFISFAIIEFPMIFYLIVHLIFQTSGIIFLNTVNLIDKILLIIFQVWSLWLLAYSLNVKKGLKIESSLIISLLLHYGGFTFILFILV